MAQLGVRSGFRLEQYQVVWPIFEISRHCLVRFRGCVSVSNSFVTIGFVVGWGGGGTTNKEQASAAPPC